MTERRNQKTTVQRTRRAQEMCTKRGVRGMSEFGNKGKSAGAEFEKCG
jgi:hypothetical protein